MLQKLLCRLGFHGWYVDSAVFFSVRRCSCCPAVENKEMAEYLDLERKLWDEEKANDYNTASTNVYIKLAPAITAMIAVCKK